MANKTKIQLEVITVDRLVKHKKYAETYDMLFNRMLDVFERETH